MFGKVIKVVYYFLLCFDIISNIILKHDYWIP